MFRIIGPILSILIAGTVFFFFVRPMFTEIQVLQGETNEYQEAVSKATEYNSRLRALISKREQFSAFDLERLDAFLPADTDEVRVLSDLEALATSHGLVFDQISVAIEEAAFDFDLVEAVQKTTVDAGKSTMTDKLVGTDMTFTVIGSYDQFKAFLVDIERSLVLMEVTKITFGAEGELTSYTVSVRLYALPENLEQ